MGGRSLPTQVGHDLVINVLFNEFQVTRSKGGVVTWFAVFDPRVQESVAFGTGSVSGSRLGAVNDVMKESVPFLGRHEFAPHARTDPA